MPNNITERLDMSALISIKAEVPVGTDINDAAIELVALSTRLDCRVWLDFNLISFFADPGETVQQVVDRAVRQNVDRLQRALDCAFDQIVFSATDAHIVRQWFEAVQDINPNFLSGPDYLLAQQLYQALGVRVPNSIAEKVCALSPKSSAG